MIYGNNQQEESWCDIQGAQSTQALVYEPLKLKIWLKWNYLWGVFCIIEHVTIFNLQTVSWIELFYFLGINGDGVRFLCKRNLIDNRKSVNNSYSEIVKFFENFDIQLVQLLVGVTRKQNRNRKTRKEKYEFYFFECTTSYKHKRLRV